MRNIDVRTHVTKVLHHRLKHLRALSGTFFQRLCALSLHGRPVLILRLFNIRISRILLLVLVLLADLDVGMRVRWLVMDDLNLPASGQLHKSTCVDCADLAPVQSLCSILDPCVQNPKTISALCLQQQFTRATNQPAVLQDFSPEHAHAHQEGIPPPTAQRSLRHLPHLPVNDHQHSGHGHMSMVDLV